MGCCVEKNLCGSRRPARRITVARLRAGRLGQGGSHGGADKRLNSEYASTVEPARRAYSSGVDCDK